MPTTVLLDADVRTMTVRDDRAEAIAVADGRILAVGDAPSPRDDGSRRRHVMPDGTRGRLARMHIREFQKVIEATYGEKDRKRGAPATFLWFTEEVGELARALNGRTSRENLELELADTLAWLTTLASIAGVDLEAIAEARYGKGCPRCTAIPCRCEEKRRPSYLGG